MKAKQSLAFPLWVHHALRLFGIPVAYLYVFGALYTAWWWPIEPWLTLGLLVSALVVLYARFIEPHWLRINHVTITAGLTKPLKIALITDLHLSRYKGEAWAARVVRETIALQPDLVLITGDMINNQFPKDDETKYLQPLAALKKFPVYYVLGNHDYGTGKPDHRCFEDRSEQVKAAMRKLGIPLLQNDLTEVMINGQKLVLFGSDDLWSRPVHYKALAHWDKKTPLLFAAHNPDTILTWPSDYPKPTFAFAGHSHGGQFALFGYPLGSATMELGRRCYSGVHESHGIPFYVSVGLGESTIPFRFGVRPELSFLTFEPKNSP